MAFPPTVSRSAMQLAIYLASRTVPSEPAIETDLERYDPAFHFVMPISLCIMIKKIVAEAGWWRTENGDIPLVNLKAIGSRSNNN
jgi:hypothetical protein